MKGARRSGLLGSVGEPDDADAVGQRRPATGHHDPGGEQARRQDRVGRLPGRELARSDLRVRLPGEHRRLAVLRVPAAPGAGRLHRARPGDPLQSRRDHLCLHTEAGSDLLGRQSRHARRCGVQSRAQHRHEPGRLLRRGVQPCAVDRGDRLEPGHDHAQGARLLAAGRARLTARDGHREGLRQAAGEELRHPGRQHHVHGSLQAPVVQARGGRRSGSQRQLLELGGQAPGW